MENKDELKEIDIKNCICYYLRIEILNLVIFY